ncbi:hypothetical protein VOLCADRAFT_92118 [Volvox carteri f. nagariensis]|uniref:Uncharacterized protein n=1 Tax=Volvox carteri f. nagariensis TaxID=3068 RepID=D8TYN0_VOLCA|nr:uncharacterized protein VOLCADRAFT_92118 [Volvox carteri f. nagariensis]EFJ47422.1 hypothetical protein VOLCADRAFT_92118 [Volvox carteri f. nagariensis]|eukprot:XP_002951611.1 hypothetical protein VOLCADRAFT_92118 [Volvox carteri f. nagariensis]
MQPGTNKRTRKFYLRCQARSCKRRHNRLDDNYKNKRTHSPSPDRANKRQEITADDPPATPLSASSAGASTTTTQNTPSTPRPDMSMVLAATAGSEDLPDRLHRMKRLKKGTLYKAIFGWEHKGFNNDLPLPASRIVIILIDDERLKDILNRFGNYFGRALSFYNVIRLDDDRTYTDLLDNLGSTAKVIYSMVPTTRWKLLDPPYLPMARVVPSTVRLITVSMLAIAARWTIASMLCSK